MPGSCRTVYSMTLNGSRRGLSLMDAMTYLLFLLLTAAWVYQFLALVCLGRFFRPPASAAPVTTGPGITVFKPLKGLSPLSRECLASFLTQDYHPYQVLFGVRDPDDPVLALLRELARAHPGCDLRGHLSGRPGAESQDQHPAPDNAPGPLRPPGDCRRRRQGGPGFPRPGGRGLAGTGGGPGELPLPGRAQPHPGRGSGGPDHCRRFHPFGGHRQLR